MKTLIFIQIQLYPLSLHQDCIPFIFDHFRSLVLPPGSKLWGWVANYKIKFRLTDSLIEWLAWKPCNPLTNGLSDRFIQDKYTQEWNCDGLVSKNKIPWLWRHYSSLFKVCDDRHKGVISLIMLLHTYKREHRGCWPPEDKPHF